ncbi:hypothetical protein DM860_011080 [Cuscuta australis]|uniref:Poly(A) RNA polymerase mitochondrial-like central palm domain-containing protein n=1 Tax=Cuscuta australis TaxID=267555 RepID=A0A328E4F5_9ASTE|nr:hypothetical protein DM860_011080 [Cuscuta australis]
MAPVLRVKVLRKKSERLERKRWQKYVVISEKIPSIEDLLDGVYMSLRPKPSDYEVRRALVFVFNEMAKDIYGPGIDAPVVEEFGSFLMDLFTTKSDLDISVNFGNNEVQFSREKKIQKLRKFAKKLYALQREGHVYGVHPITTANVPILKVVDRGTRIECDISVENRDGVLKSKIVHMICSIDERFGKLSFLMKAWAKAQNINSSKFKTLNSLSIILLVAFHLQTRNPPILPPFSAIYKDGADLAAVEKLVHNLATYGKSNKESVAELFMTLLNKLLAVENLWCKGICASTYEGSWLSKTWDFKVACISVEDFTDRSQNVARAVGVKEVKKIYKCIHNSSQHISAFMEGKIEGSTLKEYLFGRSGLSTSAKGEGTKNTNKNGRRHNKEVAVKESQQTIPPKPSLAGWDSSPSGNLGPSAAKVWGDSTSGSWEKSVLDRWGGSTTSESSEKPTSKGWGGSTTPESWGKSTVDVWGGSTTSGNLEKPTVKGWGVSTTSGNSENLILEKTSAKGWEESSTSRSWGKSTVGVWGGSTSWSIEKLNANGWGGSHSQSWGKPVTGVWGGSQTQDCGKPADDVWGGSHSKSWGKPAYDVWGGSSTLRRSEKPAANGWRGSQSTSWGKPSLNAWGGSTSESLEKQTAKGWEGSLSRSWGKATVNGWGGSTTSGSLEKQTANGWGGSQSTSWGKPTVDVGGGSITSGSLEQSSLEKPATSGWEGSQSKSLGKPVVNVWGESAPGNSEKPTAKGWGGSQSRSWEKPAVNVWRGSTSGSLEKPTAKSWRGSTSESLGKPTAKDCGGSKSRNWGKPKVTTRSWGNWGGSTSESSEKPTGKGCGRPQSRSQGKPTVYGWRGSTASGSSEKLTAKGWGGSQPTSWKKPAADVGGGSTTSGSLGKQTVNGWEGSKSISWEKPTVDVGGGSQPTSWEKPAVDVGGGSTTSGSLGKQTVKGWEGSKSISWEKTTVDAGGGSQPTSWEKVTVDVGGGSTTSRSLEKPATNGWGGSISSLSLEKRATNGWGGSTPTSWGTPTVGFWRGTAPSEGSRKSLFTKRKWSDENMGETSTGKLGTAPTNGWTGGKQPTQFKPMKRSKHFNGNWGGKNAGGWEMASPQPADNDVGWGKWGGT